jgi:hypothetical protein
MLPLVEDALALNGYRIDIAHQRSRSGASAVVMAHELTSILLAADPAREVGLIEVWGVPQAAAVQLIEALPIEFIKQACK